MFTPGGSGREIESPRSGERVSARQDASDSRLFRGNSWDGLFMTAGVVKISVEIFFGVIFFLNN